MFIAIWHFLINLLCVYEKVTVFSSLDKKHVKNTNIPVLTSILMAVYQYFVFAMAIRAIIIFQLNQEAGY